MNRRPFHYPMNRPIADPARMPLGLAGFSWPRISSFIGVGDSITDRSTALISAVNGIGCNVTGWQTMLEILSEGRLRGVGPTAANLVKTGSALDRDHGYSGSTADEWLNGSTGWPVGFLPVTDALAASADCYIIHIGTNDIRVATWTAQTVIDNVHALWTALVASGKPVIGTDVLQRAATNSGWNSTFRDTVDTINTALRASWKSYGLRAYRQWNDLIDKDVNGYAAATEFPNDGLHPTQRVSLKLANDLLAFFSDKTGGTAYTIPASGAASWITPNPYVVGNTSGAADNWTAYLYGPAGTGHTLEKVTDSEGTWQRVNVLTSKSAWGSGGMYARITSGLPAAGTKVRVCARVRVAAGSSFRGFGMAIASGSGGPFHFVFNSTSIDAESSIGAYTGIMMSDEIEIPAGATQLWCYITHAQGTGTYDFQKAGIFTV
jgi:hypothetical protein